MNNERGSSPPVEAKANATSAMRVNPTNITYLSRRPLVEGGIFQEVVLPNRRNLHNDYNPYAMHYRYGSLSFETLSNKVRSIQIIATD